MVGAFGMTGIAYRTGLIGGAAHLSPLDTFVARANDARSHQRWDEPPGDNVRDLTDEGLSRWPKEPKLVKIRQGTCEDLVKAAAAKHDEGDPDAALHLARLATSLDPTSAEARNLVASWSPPEEKVMVASEVAVPPLAPLAVARTATPTTFTPSSTSSGSSGTRATLEASSPKPAVGQPVDFMAHVAGGGAAKPPKVEGARFRVSGPGLAGNQLDAADDGAGNFRTTFTFMQSGRFEVTFLAKSDGAGVRVSRTVVVAGADKAGADKAGADRTSAAAAPSAAPAQAPTVAPAPPEPQPQPSAAPPANSGKFI
jgi:hypothetical protein